MNDAQYEILEVLKEEAAELIHAASKATRHGLDGSNPNSRVKVTNLDQLRKEIADVMMMITLAMFVLSITKEDLKPLMESKASNLMKYSDVFDHLIDNYDADDFTKFVHALGEIDIKGDFNVN